MPQLLCFAIAINCPCAPNQSIAGMVTPHGESRTCAVSLGIRIARDRLPVRSFLGKMVARTNDLTCCCVAFLVGAGQNGG